MSPAWWAAFGPADCSVQCGSSEHRLRWADGTLQALDHPDAEGELVLSALGGDTSPCLDLVMAWGKHCDDLTVLTVGPRSADDKLTIPATLLDDVNAASQTYHGLGNPAAQLRSSGGGFIRRGPVSSAVTYTGHSSRFRRRVPPPVAARAVAMRRARMLQGHTGFALVAGWHGNAGWSAPVDEARHELIRLLALGSPFQFRLSAAVAHAWSADGAQASRASRARPALTAALAGRLAPAAAHWLTIDPADVEVSVHDADRWGELTLTKTGRLQARLPLSWLASVWAPGFAVVDQHLVVSVLDADWPTARVLAVRSPGGEPAELSIRQDQGHWAVTSQ